MIATLLIIASTGLTADLRVGQQAPAFTTAAIDGNTVDFPQSYKGKLVLVDCFATWCGPCMKEMPNVVRAYQAHHANGLEIISVSFDRQRSELNDFVKRNRIEWPQIHSPEGQNQIGPAYGAQTIPLMVLVNGDTGNILATTQQLRGPGLTNLIARELAKKKR